MNHSKAFWAVRNSYADQMRTLWGRGYTGEGVWGRGALLETGAFESNTVSPNDILPEHLCGGTYRSRRRKRKAKDQLTYKERKERRILKKFGANGVALGDDEDIKAELEKGRRTQAKPRVADSKRGRELRAAAALARFDQQKKTTEPEKGTPADEDETASEDESETASESEGEGHGAIDIDGKRLLDGKGNRMIRVCEDENPEDYDAQNELKELQSSMTPAKLPGRAVESSSSRPPTESLKSRPIDKATVSLPVKSKKLPSQSTVANPGGDERQPLTRQNLGVCPLCSYDNGVDCTTCAVCAHVLDSRKVVNTWKCPKVSCRESLYLNAGDAALCGVCGARRGSPP